MNRKVHFISASQVETFLTCPLAYKHIYVTWATRTPWNIYISYWTAIHEALEFNFRQKIKSRKDLDYYLVEEKFKEILSEENNSLRKQWVFTKAETLELLVLQWWEMIYKYMNEIAPSYQPIMVEHRFEIPLKSYPVTIMGFIDMITEDWIIVDFKTCGTTTHQKWTQNYVDNLLQMTMYALAYRVMFQKQEQAIRIEALKRLKDWPVINQIDTFRSDLDIVALVQLMDRMEKMIAQAAFYPNLNSCPTCDFRNSCTKLSYM